MPNGKPFAKILAAAAFVAALGIAGTDAKPAQAGNSSVILSISYGFLLPGHDHRHGHPYRHGYDRHQHKGHAYAYGRRDHHDRRAFGHDRRHRHVVTPGERHDGRDFRREIQRRHDERADRRRESPRRHDERAARRHVGREDRRPDQRRQFTARPGCYPMVQTDAGGSPVPRDRLVCHDRQGRSYIVDRHAIVGR